MCNFYTLPRRHARAGDERRTARGTAGDAEAEGDDVMFGPELGQAIVGAIIALVVAAFVAGAAVASLIWWVL